jgi:hypothetical protein
MINLKKNGKLQPPKILFVDDEDPNVVNPTKSVSQCLPFVAAMRSAAERPIDDRAISSVKLFGGGSVKSSNTRLSKFSAAFSLKGTLIFLP